MVADFLKHTNKPPASVKETVDWLLRLGRPPLPENPLEAAKQGREPKAPCFFDGRRLISISWKHWQHQQPIPEIYETWFAHPSNGIGTLGGWNGKHWLAWVDFDKKDFPSAEECDRSIVEWVEKYPVLANAPMFRTPSGGYRFLIAFEVEPQNFKANSGFSLSPDGIHHVGEMLCKNGGHTLLPPTKGLSGESYQWVRWSEYPPVVLNPEDIGIYALDKAKKTTATPSTHRTGYLGENSLVDILRDEVSPSLTHLLEDEISPRLTLEQAFNWHGHEFKQYGDKLKGNCPWHESASGTSFYVERKGNSLLWRCPACDIGGNFINYRHRLAGGNGSPRGQEFVDLVKELADEVGVSMPVQGSPKRNNVIAHPTVKNQEIDCNAIKIEYIKLLGNDASQTEIESFKIQTRRKYPLLQPSELNRLLKAVEDEFHKAESLTNDAEELRKLLEVSEQTIMLSDFLPQSLSNPLTQYCEWQNIRHGVVLTSLLTSISSLHRVGTELILHKNLDFAVPPTLYSAIVAESGSKKSPIFRATAKSPLNRLRERAYQEHQERVEEYMEELLIWEEQNKNLKNGEKPDTSKPIEPTLPPPFYITDTTGEGLKAQAQKAPDKALFLLVDELAGYLGSHDKYRAGKGSDKQDLLSYYDGTGATVLRAGGVKIDIPRIYLSILGTIQPDVIKKIMGNTKDIDGTWARWLFVHQPNIPTTLPDDLPCGIDCTDVVTGYFEKVFDLPTTTYRLSWEAFKLYQPFYNRLEQLRVSHSIPGLRAVYAKAEGLVGRLALNLHVLHELAEGHSPSEVIPVERMQQAIALMRFYIGQTRMLHASVDDGESLAPHIHKVIELSKRKQLAGENGFIKASDVQKNTTASKRPSAVEAREWMIQASRLGYGVLNGEGNKVEFKSTLTIGSPTPPIGINRLLEDNQRIAETIAVQPSYKIVDTIDKIDDSQNRYFPAENNLTSQYSDVGIEKSIYNGASIGLLETQNPFTASDTGIEEISVEPSVEESIVEMQEPNHQSSVGFGKDVDGVCIDSLETMNESDVPKPEAIKFKIGDRIEFVHEMERDVWRRGQIIDIKEEQGYFMNLTVSYEEYNRKTKQRENKQYVICREDWVRQR